MILRKNLWKTIPDLWKTLGRSVDNCRVLKAEDKKMAQQQKLGGLIFGGCSRLLLPICERANGVHMYRAFLAIYWLATGYLLVGEENGHCGANVKYNSTNFCSGCEQIFTLGWTGAEG